MALSFDSVADAHAWMRREFGTWEDRPTDAHFEALRDYKASGFEMFNEALREHRAKRFDEPLHLAVTEAIAAESISAPVRVYRGIDDPDVAELVLLWDATEIPHEGFVSVSLVEHVATRFMSNGDDDDGGDGREDLGDVTDLLLIADLPIGTHAAPLDFIPQGSNANEAELLLHAGSTFVIDDIDDSDLSVVRVTGRWRAP